MKPFLVVIVFTEEELDSLRNLMLMALLTISDFYYMI